MNSFPWESPNTVSATQNALEEILRYGPKGSAPVVPPPSGAGRGFGGHVAAIALRAAYESVEPSKRVHHLNIDFIRPTESGAPLVAEVRSLSDGASVSRRTVELSHPGGKLAAFMTATFIRSVPESPSYQPAPPDLPSLDTTTLLHDGIIEVRSAPQTSVSHQTVWMRPFVPLRPQDEATHASGLLFASDLTLLWPMLSVHAGDVRDRHTALVSVSHSMWFHRQASFNGWQIYDQRVTSTSDGYGQCSGQIWSANGALIADVLQVGKFTA